MTAIYRQEVIDRAREHVEHGWSLEDTRRLLRKEFRQEPSKSTIQAWVSPDVVARARDRYRPRERAVKVSRSPNKPRSVTPERALERMRAMYHRGVSLKAIGQVAACWWGEELDAKEVKSRLGLRSGEVVHRRTAT